MDALLLCKQKRGRERLVVLFLSSSSVRSVLVVKSVDHGGKQVDAAAALLLPLWALGADRYSMVQHFNATLTKKLRACISGCSPGTERTDSSRVP